MKEIFNLGLKFIPNGQPIPNMLDYIKSTIQRLECDIRIFNHHGTPPRDLPADIKFKPTSTWNPPRSLQLEHEILKPMNSAFVEFANTVEKSEDKNTDFTTLRRIE